MTLRELIVSVNAGDYADSKMYQTLLKVKPEYGSNRRIVVRQKDGYPIEVDSDLQVSKVQLLDAILNELSSHSYDEGEQADFWNEMTNLQKSKDYQMMLPKFIITMDGVFRLGMVNQHKDLLKPGEQCVGGGYYHFDYVSNRIVLDRSSYDFLRPFGSKRAKLERGKPKWHLLDTLKVPSTYRGMRLVYVYDDGFHDDFEVNNELNIEYYD